MRLRCCALWSSVPRHELKAWDQLSCLHAEQYAAAHGVHALYLLTTTAESFFEHRGYRRIDRAEAPPSIQSTREFSSLCPASSAFMIKRL